MPPATKSVVTIGWVANPTYLPRFDRMAYSYLKNHKLGRFRQEGVVFPKRAVFGQFHFLQLDFWHVANFGLLF